MASRCVPAGAALLWHSSRVDATVTYMKFGRLCDVALLRYKATAQDAPVCVIDDGGLAGGDGAFGVLELDAVLWRCDRPGGCGGVGGCDWFEGAGDELGTIAGADA